MNGVVILLLVLGGYQIVNSSMQRLEGIIKCYSKKQRINLGYCDKKKLEDEYTKFWRKHKFKLKVAVLFSFGYATFILLYPALNCNIIWLDNFWIQIIVVVSAMMILFIIVYAISSFGVIKVHNEIGNMIRKNNYIVPIIFQPVLIVIMFIAVIVINENSFNCSFVDFMIRIALINLNIVTIQDIENAFEKLIEMKCMQIENQYKIKNAK